MGIRKYPLPGGMGMGQKLYTRWFWDGDEDEFLLWGWG